MKAAVWKKPGKYQVTQVPDPQIAGDEILIQVKACGICGSDKFITNHLENGMIQGHEGSGIVVEGKASKKGNRVWFFPGVVCKKCDFCHRGKPQLCERMNAIGHGNLYGPAIPGVWAEYVKIPKENIVELPSNVRFEEAVLVEPMGAALRAVNRSWDPYIRSVVVMGLGTIGLSVIQFLNLRGVEKIIAVDISDAHFGIARKFGAASTITNREQNVSIQVEDITGGLGSDMVVNTVSANTEILNQALDITAKGGKIVCVAEVEKMLPFDYASVVHKELTLIGSLGGVPWYPSVISMLAKKLIDAKSLITHQLPLYEVQKAFDLTCRPESTKVIMKP